MFFDAIHEYFHRQQDLDWCETEGACQQLFLRPKKQEVELEELGCSSCSCLEQWIVNCLQLQLVSRCAPSNIKASSSSDLNDKERTGHQCYYARMDCLLLDYIFFGHFVSCLIWVNHKNLQCIEKHDSAVYSSIQVKLALSSVLSTFLEFPQNLFSYAFADTHFWPDL